MIHSYACPLEAPPDDHSGHGGQWPDADPDDAPRQEAEEHGAEPSAAAIQAPKWSTVADTDDGIPDTADWATYADDDDELEDVAEGVVSDVPEWSSVADTDDEVAEDDESDEAGTDMLTAAVEEHRIRVERSARVFAFGGADGVRQLWIVLHGYGQLGRRFAGELTALDGAQRRVVVPEALSRYYLSGTDGPVGASWMTREEREHEIADYVAYLDAVYDYSVQGLEEQPEIHLLGFSQGAETAARWAVMGKASVHRLILWGGRLPADLDVAANAEVLRGLHLTIVLGTEDSFATPERVAEQEEELNRHMIPFHTVTFEGGHRLDGETLAWLVED